MVVENFPNPSKAAFNCIVNSYAKSDIAIQIFDMLGRQLYQSEIKPGILKQVGRDLKSGSYILQAKQGDILITKKIIKL